MTNPTEIVLSNALVAVQLRIDAEGTVLLESVTPVQTSANGVVPLNSLKKSSRFFDSSALPLAHIRLSNEGNAEPSSKSGKHLIQSYTTEGLKYVSHNEIAAKGSKTLHVQMHNADRAVTVTSHLTIYDSSPFVRSSATAKNDGKQDIILTQLTSAVFGGLTDTAPWWSEYEISYAHNNCFREADWHTLSPAELGLSDTGMYEIDNIHNASMNAFSLASRSSFGTNGHLPMGMLQKKGNGEEGKSGNSKETWLWQVESNGYWRWDLGDYRDSIYVAAGGPDGSHEWRHRLAPGAEFTTCEVGFCHVMGDSQLALAELTQYRRLIRRTHPDHKQCPIIFNDYMNCLMGDPTEEKILSLLDPVMKSGAEYFVIDSGWYADDSDWWYDVGLWEPSKKRFPNGFNSVLDRIRDAGLKPGLWVETEVVGCKSVVADRLPRDAFFQRDGHRIMEKGRYQLDYRHPAVIEWMDSVIDNLVVQYGIKYFKFDYNIEIVSGTDINASSAGSGAYEHCRAYLQWIDRLLDRYPDLVIENCSSGAQRMDYAMLSSHTLQSTSDQQDPVRYAAISASIATAVAPEQSATWAYPQGDWSDEINAMTVVNSLLGRIHLSGRLDQMRPEQLRLIYEGMEAYNTSIRGMLPTSLPFWPLGLGSWHDDWLAYGLRSEDGGKCVVAVWRRGGAETACTLPIVAFKDAGGSVDVRMLYPANFEGSGSWDSGASALQVKLPATQCTRVFELKMQ